MAPVFRSPDGKHTITVSGDVALAQFHANHADYLEVVEPLVPDGDPSDAWKVPALQAWAKAHDVDLAGATKKDDILAAIAAALKPADAGNPPA